MSCKHTDFLLYYEFDREAETHSTARETALDRTERSLRVGFEYDVTDITVETTPRAYCVSVTVHLTRIPERTQTNLAFWTQFPDALDIAAV